MNDPVDRPVTVERVRATVAVYFASIRALDAQAFAGTFAPEGVSHDPVGAPPLRGRAQLVAFFEGLAGSFKSVDMREREIYPVANGAAVRWTCAAVAKDGRPVQFDGIDVFELDAQARVQTLRSYWDPAAMQAQLAPRA